MIAFDNLNFESPLLRISNRGTPDLAKTTFRVTFTEVGTFPFVCRIYTWMKGEVQVFSKHEAIIQTEEIKLNTVKKTTTLHE